MQKLTSPANMRPASDTYDAIVIGAGAAGLLGAARLGELGCRTLLLEKNRKPGVKILMSGGTRCNLTQNTDARGIIQGFGKSGKFLHSALAALNPTQLVQLFHQEGVVTKVEVTGKIFPATDRALDVQQALLRRLDRCGVELRLECPVQNVTPLPTAGELAAATSATNDADPARFAIETPAGTLFARHVLVTSGGMSYPGCGTTGDGYPWAEAMEHTIVTPRPALTPLKSPAEWVRELAGVTVPDVSAYVVPHERAADLRQLAPAKLTKKAARSARGSFLFTHRGLSGPVPMNVSRAITDPRQPGPHVLICDFLPAQTLTETEAWLTASGRQSGKRQVLNLLMEQLPKRLAEGLLRDSSLATRIRPTQPLAELSRRQREALLQAVHRQIIPLHGTLGFAKAEVTAGGVSLAEVDSSSLQSKLQPGLFFAGEILDLDGPIGGYNFQAAFSTAWLAAEQIAESRVGS